MKTIVRSSVFASCLALPVLVTSLSAQVPQLINYQGRVVVAGTNFNGAGQFKFALVNSNAIPTFWSNNGTSVNGSEPGAAVSLTVANGLYSVLLGDATLANMTVIPATVFTNADVRLRVWFNGGSGFQQLTPDQRIAAVGYAMMSANVADGVITASKLADGAVTANKLADGSVTGAKLSADAVTSATLADTLALGNASNAVGRLDIFRTTSSNAAISLIGSDSSIRTYGSDGKEQIRLWGVGWGEIFLNDSSTNNRTAVALTANGIGGGLLQLYQADGNLGLSAHGDSSGSGLLQLRSTNGATRVSIYGKSPDSGGGEVSVNDDTGDEVVEIKGNSNGGQLTIKDETGTRSTAFLGSSSVGGYEYLYNAIGSISVYLDGDSGGAGFIGVRNTNGSTRVVMDGYSTGGGGEISVYDTTGTETVEILGAESSNTGGQILMRNGNGGTTIQLDSDASGVACGYMALYRSNGVANIVLDSADGTVTAQVVEITGGSDLSEKFDIGGIDQAHPGMVVCIDPENPGRLIPSQRAYDRTVAGVVSGAGGVAPGMLMGQSGTLAHGKHPVALTGRVYCMVDADAGGAIVPGDLITTSDTPGHAMKVGEFARSQGATIGKAMTSLKSGKGLVLVLVSLQ